MREEDIEGQELRHNGNREARFLDPVGVEAFKQEEFL
jgi:hypothetical protein